MEPRKVVEGRTTPMNRRPFALRLGAYPALVATLLSSATLPALEIVDGWATLTLPAAARTEMRV
ncbi:MAG: hypothetical protein ACFCVC_06645 [Acidimicrobiia bacterium]